MKNLLKAAPRLAKGQAGVTLIEQVMAVALIGLAIVVWFNVTKVQTKGVVLSKNNLRAQNLALTKLEDLRSLAINAGNEGQFRWVTQSPTVIQYGLTNTSTVEAKVFTWSVSTTFISRFKSLTETNPGPLTSSAAEDNVMFFMTVRWGDVVGLRILTQTAYVTNPRK